MNMDVICIANAPERGKYLLAAGRDEYCDIYETTDYFSEISGESPSLGLNFRPVGRIRTDFGNVESPYQVLLLFIYFICILRNAYVLTNLLEGKECSLAARMAIFGSGMWKICSKRG